MRRISQKRLEELIEWSGSAVGIEPTDSIITDPSGSIVLTLHELMEILFDLHERTRESEMASPARRTYDRIVDLAIGAGVGVVVSYLVLVNFGLLV